MGARQFAAMGRVNPGAVSVADRAPSDPKFDRMK